MAVEQISEPNRLRRMASVLSARRSWLFVTMLVGVGCAGVFAFVPSSEAAQSTQPVTVAPSIGPSAPSAKQAIADAINQRVTAARATTPTGTSGTMTPVAVPTSAMSVSGINNDLKAGPFPPSMFLVNNAWQGDVNSTWLVVYAGASGDVVGLRVYSRNPNPNEAADLQFIGQYTDPAANSSLGSSSNYVITSGDGEVLTLSSGSTFNLNDLAFST
jgi:hypothetical protein